MSDSHTVPYPYRLSRVDTLDTVGTPDPWPRYYTQLGVFHGATYVDEELIELLLIGLDTRLKREGINSRYGVPARAEFFWEVNQSGQEIRRGMVLFDNRGRALFHAMHALLGYNGSGPGLSRRILKAIGVSDDQFNAVNAKLDSQRNYVVVFSREKRDEVDGVLTAATFGDVDSTWQSWRVR